MKVSDVRDNDSLLEVIETGERIKYVFFWGHEEPQGKLSKACLGQWYPIVFEHNGDKYLTAEHWMMAEKARLFNDEETLAKILKAKHPSEAKKLGRLVSNFDSDVWEGKRSEIVASGNKLKFGQNKSIKEFLMNTGDRVLVEASPVDKIWGIGLAQDHKHVESPDKWKGLNLLGYALMEVRASFLLDK